MNRQRLSRGVHRWGPGIGTGVVLLGGLLALAGSEAAMQTIQRAIARMTSSVLNLLGQSTTVAGTTVQSHLFGINVVAACTGVFLTGLYLVAVAVLPTRWGAKLVGAGIGIAGIFIVNLLRLVSLYLLGVYWPAVLDPVHQLVWQSLAIVLAVVIWLWWAGRWGHVPSKA
jgi:exosortase/archaeosortase family protein